MNTLPPYATRYRVPDEEIRDSYRRTRSIHKTGEEVGRSGQSVLNRLKAMGEPIIGPGPRTPGLPLTTTRGAKFHAQDLQWIEQVQTEQKLKSPSSALRFIVARDRQTHQEEQ